jgi:hypothetical protein
MTSIELLFNKLWEEPKDKLTWYSILEEAKQMHKAEILAAANTLLYHSTGPGNTAAETYYQETFNKQQ